MIYIMQQLTAITETIDEQRADQQMKELSALAGLYEQRGGNLGY